MNKITELTLILSFGTNFLFGQISDAFHANDKADIKNRSAVEIVEELKIGNATIRYSKKINQNNQIITDERQDNNGKFIAKFEYTYDSITHLKIMGLNEYLDKSGNHYFNTEKFEYDDQKFITKIIYLSDNGSVSQIVQITNNEKGHPVKSASFTESGLLTGSETASYNYDENKASYDKKDSNGIIFYSGFFSIDKTKEKNFSKPGFEYNGSGDLVKTPDWFSTIIYDQYGNWTSIKMFKKVGGVDKLTQERTRVIKYRE